MPGVDIKPLIAEVQARARDELDYELEAEAQRAFAEAFRDDPDIVVPDVVDVGEHTLVTEWLESPYSLARVIREGTQEERDHYGELFVRFLFAGPARTGMLHADPHPGNFRILPAADGGLGRLGVLDFGAVARLESRGLPEAMGRLIRIAGDADRDGLEAGLRAEGFIKDRVRIDPDLLLDYLAPFVEPTKVEQLPVHPGVDARAVPAHQQPAGAHVHGRDEAQPAAVVPAHPPHLARRHRRAQPARGRGAVPGDPRGVPAGLRITLTGHWPVDPSIDSRIRSAWPRWRAYSSIMCTMIHRMLSGSPGLRLRWPTAISVEVVRLGEDAPRAVDLGVPQGPDLGRRQVRRDRPLRVAVGLPVEDTHGSPGRSPRKISTNHQLSTHARCVTIPPSVIVDGSSRRCSCSASRSPAFIRSVARIQSRNAVSMVSSSATCGMSGRRAAHVGRTPGGRSVTQ